MPAGHLAVAPRGNMQYTEGRLRSDVEGGPAGCMRRQVVRSGGMSGGVMEPVLFLAGLVVGIITAVLFMKKRISDAATVARGEGEVERALLHERLNGSAEEAQRLRGELAQWERQGEEVRRQLEASRNDAARLAERASRVPVLEQELRAAIAGSEEQNRQIAALRQKLGGAQSTMESQLQDITRLTNESVALAARRDQLLAELHRLANQLTEISTTLEAERTQNDEKLALLNEAREQLTHQFKALAAEILEEKAKRFTEQNQANIGQLLAPLKTKLAEFQGKVEEVYVQEGKERSALAEQVRHLMSLNRQLSDDAHNLTRALKGSSKIQGNWGEMILEKILEASGLRQGDEYHVQESHVRDDGSRVQPDVVIHLPGERHIVVDAKVSLTAYEEYVNAPDDAGRDTALKRHLDSVRLHIKGLSDKNYQEIHGVKSLDFVLMFIPVEPAFMLAISQDNEVWQDAWKRNVLLVSPSTLLFVVRTVAHLWRQEQQNRNAQEIAHRGAELYDKLVGFVDDLRGVGTRLAQAQKTYEDAYGKFVGGKGNVIRQAELLKGLGLKPGKQLPPELTGSAPDGVVNSGAP
jgi:DNA recombination protein RmuC